MTPSWTSPRHRWPWLKSWGQGSKAFYKPSKEQPKQFITWCLGRPTMDGNTALGASSPAKPALQSPDPLSQTRAVLSSSSHIFYSSACGLPDRKQPCENSREELNQNQNHTQVAEPPWPPELQGGEWPRLGITRTAGLWEGMGFLLKAWELSAMPRCTRDYPGNSRGDFQPWGTGREIREQQMFI